MRFVFSVFWSSLVLVAVAAFGLVVITRTDLYPLNIDPDVQYLPGHTLPTKSSCDWHSYQFGYYYCNAETDTGPVAFTYRDGMITFTSKRVNDVTLGRLILAWGQPTGYIANSGYVQVYWVNRYATLIDDPFTPMSDVSFVSYDLQPPEADYVHPLPWHGFSLVK